MLLYRDVARTEAGIGTLHDVTAGHLGRSTRHNEFLRPQGYGDELRAALRAGTSTWGVVSLFRDAGRRPFSRDEVAVMRNVGPKVAAALRRFAIAEAPAPTESDAPGTVLYSIDGDLLSMDHQADRWLSEVAGADWKTNPGANSSIICSTLALAVPRGRDAVTEPAFGRLRSASGRWLVLQASCLTSPDGVPTMIALSVGPAKSSQIAPIVVEAYGLTVRERQITEAVARGLSNVEMAEQLFLSPHTVRDHLKAIFAKVGVSSRGELVAKVFAEHYGPGLHNEERPAVHAFF